MAVYIAKEPIQHNGVRTEPGAELKLSDAHAAPLLAIGHIEAKAKPTGKASAADAPAGVPAVGNGDAAAEQGAAA
jgi:hypothetical protein